MGWRWGRSGAAWPKPRPRLVLRGQLRSLAEAGSPGRSGTDRPKGRDGTGQGGGVWAACGAGVPRRSQGPGVRLSVCLSWAPWLSRSGPPRLSHRAADRERMRGRVSWDSSTVSPLSRAGWRRSRSASGNGVGGSVVLRSVFLQSVCVFIRGAGRCCTGLGQPPAPRFHRAAKEPSCLPLCPHPLSGATLQPSARRSPPCPPTVSVPRPISDRPSVGPSLPGGPRRASAALPSRSPAGAAAFIGARSTRAAAHSCGRGSYTLTRCRRQQGI